MDLLTDFRTIIDTAMSRGGDYADIFIEHTTTNSISLKDSKVNSAGHHIDYGIGIRVIKGDKTGYAYTESDDFADIMNAAKVAAGIAEGSIKAYSTGVCVKKLQAPNRYPVLMKWEDYPVKSKISKLEMLDRMIFEADKRVDKVMAQLTDTNSEIDFINSLGEYFHDSRPLFSCVVTCVMKDGSRTENGSSSRSFRSGSEMFTDRLIKEMAEEAVSKTSLLFQARQPKGGRMPVVMGKGGSGILLHEAIGHAFEADFNRKNTSIFADKMGKRICMKGINIVDDGTITANRGSVNFDDEGVPGQKTYMVTDGILTSYLHDRISAKYYNTAPTGNGRRESFRYMPIPRMRATYMENGNCSEEDLIKEVKYGIYADNFSNGQVQIGAGDFTFYVKSGYLIENGKLTAPVKDFNIIGNGPEALAAITAVADNATIDNGTWTCGKEQYCKVSCGMPSALVSSLTVGGIEQ